MIVLPTREVRCATLDEPVRLYASGDWHVGEHGCDEARLQRDIERMSRDKRGLVLLMGDLGGFIAPDDRRWEPGAVADWLTLDDLQDWGFVLTEKICALAKPIKGRLVGVIEGNHEGVYSRRNHCKVSRRIADKLGTAYLGYSCLFTVRFIAGDEHVDLTIHATHGAGAAATPGGKINRLVKAMHAVDADLVLMGHVHERLQYSLSRVRQDGNQIGSRDQLGVVTGTYLRTYSNGHSGYGERAGYAPVTLGGPVIEIVPRDKSMTVGWL